MAAQNLLSEVNLRKPPQWASEGNGATNYAKSLAAPVFTCPLQNSKMERGLDNVFIDKKFRGSLYQQGRFKVKENNSITVSGDVLDSDTSFEIVQWAIKAQSETVGPVESRTWIESYTNSAGTEIYKIAKGCKPMDFELSISAEGALMLKIAMSCRDYYETAAPTTNTGITGSPTYVASESAADPVAWPDIRDHISYKPTLNGGKNALVPTRLNVNSITIGGQWTQRSQSSSGTDRDVYKDYSGFAGSLSAEIYKSGADLNEDARKDLLTVAWVDFTPKSGQTEGLAKANASGAQGINVISKLPGTAGNTITFEIKAPNTKAKETQIAVSGHDITVTPKNGGDTVAKIITALQEDDRANAMAFFEKKDNDSANINSAVAKVTCAGGSDAYRRVILERFAWQVSDEPMQGDTDATMESKSGASQVAIYSPNIS